FGSRTTPVMAQHLRRVAAAARELLVDLAAREWNVDRDAPIVIDGVVRNGMTGESLDFGKLTKGRKLSRVITEELATMPAGEWTCAGRSQSKVDGRAFVTGQHRYASDIARPGLWHGKVLRPPELGATLVAVDAKWAEGLTDVVIVRDGDFVGVVAPD